MDLFNERKVIWLDGYYFGGLAFICAILTLNIFFNSLLLIYLAILSVLAFLVYASGRQGAPLLLRGVWLMGLLSLPLYPCVDYLFEARLKEVTYLTDDPKLLVTPIYIFLYWLLGVSLFGYCYYRILGVTGRRWVAGLMTGLFAAGSTTVVENLFNLMGFYHNTSSYPLIGYIPLFIPLGYLFTFSLMPLYLRYGYLAGLLLYAFTGASWWIFYQLISWMVSTCGR